MKVLIYGKSSESRTIIQNYVSQLSESIRFISLDNLQQTILSLGTNSYDLIIIDVDRHDESFKNLIAYAKSSCPDASILILTLFDADSHDNFSLRRGTDYRFGKYFAFEEFISSMKRVANQILNESNYRISH